nr:PREDICTED: histone H3.v1-like isoform X2 [Bemisia tabaci]
MFAKVVFKDNEEAVVPVDYIKDFDAQKVVPGDECPVFWSLKGKLTPKDVLKKQGVIHRIDQLKKQTDKHGNPLPGYYDAEIKMLADSIDELSKQPTRVKKASAKAAQLMKDKEEKEKIKHKPKKTGESSKSKFKKPEENPKNIDQLLSDSSEDVVEPVAGYKKRIESLERELKSLRKRKENIEEERDVLRNEVEQLKEKMDKVRGENEDLRQLNLELQKRVLLKGSDTSPGFSRYQKSPGSIKKRLFDHASPAPSISGNLWEERETDTATPTKKMKVSDRNEKMKKTPSPLKARSQSVPGRSTTDLSHVGKVTPRRSKSVDDKHHAATMSSKDATPPSLTGEEQMSTPPSAMKRSQSPSTSPSRQSPRHAISLDAATMRMCLHGVRDGAGGDAMYAKNLALALYGEEELMHSSVTGTASKRFKTEAKPKLERRKWELLKSLYEKRVKSSIIDGDPDEKVRINRLNTYIADKIQKLSQRAKRKS